MMKYLYIYIMFALAVTLQGCDGTFDGLYDEAVNDGEQQFGVQAGNDETRFTIVLDARSYEHWHYINLHD